MSRLSVKLAEQQLKDVVHTAYCAGAEDTMERVFPEGGALSRAGTFDTHWDKVKAKLPGVVTNEP